MDCRDVDERLEEAHLEFLPPAERQEIREHLEGCATCREGMKRVDEVERLLRRAGEEPVAVSGDEIKAGLERARSLAGPRLAWVKVLPLAVAGLFFGAILLWFLAGPAGKDWGTELTYRMLLPDSSESEAGRLAPEVKRVLERRLKDVGFGSSEIAFEGDLVRIKVPGAAAKDVAPIKRVLKRVGHLQLRPAADWKIQDQYKSDGLVPEGYEAFENPHPQSTGEYGPWSPKLLVHKKSVIEGRHIIKAEPQQTMGIRGEEWVTAFELDAEGAVLFDQAAKELYYRRPRGILAILMDGVLRSAPIVVTESLHGTGQISGAKSEEDAKDLAIILMSGGLPVPLGREVEGVKSPGEPESERPYGPGK